MKVSAPEILSALAVIAIGLLVVTAARLPGAPRTSPLCIVTPHFVEDGIVPVQHCLLSHNEEEGYRIAGSVPYLSVYPAQMPSFAAQIGPIPR